MKLKVKFKGMDLRGNIVKAKHTFECPDFKEEEVSFYATVDGVYQEIKYTRTVEDQVNNWLDEKDKMDLIYNWDWQCIIDWKVMKAKNKKHGTIVTYINKEEQVLAIGKILLRNSPDMYYNFEAVYHSMRKSIKHLKINTQINIVFSSLDTATQAAITAYKHIGDILKEDYTEEEEDRYNELRSQSSTISLKNRMNDV